MTPEQFLAHLRQPSLPPAYLFLGPELYRRQVCRKALIERVLPPEERESGFTRHDLGESPLSVILDDASSLSLFASHRLVWVSAAEAALPRTRAGMAEEEGDTGPKAAPAAPLAGYLKNPLPGTVLVFDASRFDFEGEDKAKLERVRRFYSAIPHHVEFTRFSGQQARLLAQDLARRAGLQIESRELDVLVEALSAEAGRIAVEIEKLRLYRGGDQKITVEDIAAIVPDARATTIFALVGALGRGDSTGSLEVLDTLLRQGEYPPLALTFLAGHFRLVLAAKEARLGSSPEIQAYFSRLGMPMWRARAEQIEQTAMRFSAGQLAAALQKISSADKALRDARPDDRLVMEDFMLGLRPSGS